MNTDEAVARLDAMMPGDNEATHSEADTILLQMVPEAVRAAYERTRERIPFWYA